MKVYTLCGGGETDNWKTSVETVPSSYSTTFFALFSISYHREAVQVDLAQVPHVICFYAVIKCTHSRKRDQM